VKERKSRVERIEPQAVSEELIRIYEFPSVNYQRFYGLLSRKFGLSEHQWIGHNTLQENWHRRGLFINVTYHNNHSGLVSLLVTVTQESTLNTFGQVLKEYME
jgi:hypothetical protein